MKRSIFFFLITGVLVDSAAIWHNRANIYCRLFPERCLAGVWDIERTTGNFPPLSTGMFNIIDFDPRDSLVAYSDSVCTGPGHRYRVHGGELWLLPWDGRGETIDESENPERLRMRFQGTH